MADRTKLDFNFISLTLSVNGRVRPVDLHSIPESGRANALQAFYQANAASMPMHFEGDVLVKGAGGVTAAPQASAAPPPVEQPPAPPLADFASPPPVEQPPAPPVSDYSAAAPVSPAPAAPVSPESDYAPSALVSPPEFAAPAPAAASLSSGDFFPAPSTDPIGAPLSATAPAAQFDLPSEKISIFFWLLPILLTWVGGIIAFYLVRKLNPKTAKAMLVTGIVLTVVLAVAAAAAAVSLGMLSISGF